MIVAVTVLTNAPEPTFAEQDSTRIALLVPAGHGAVRRSCRRVLAGCAALVVAVGACGNDGTTSDSGVSEATPLEPVTTDAPAISTSATDSALSAATEPAGADAFPVTIEHKFATTEITAQPQRIVALGYTELDYVLALGYTPVAARYPQFGDESNAVQPWAEQAAGGSNPDVLNFQFGELGFEAIAALEPDLILAVTSGITAEEYETLSGIAPTVAQTDEFIDFGMPWQDTTLLIGRALGREDLARESVAEVEDRFAEARDGHREFDGLSVASAYYGESEVLFFASEDLRARFFTDLGFEVPAELDEIAGDEFFGSISPERLDLIDTDVLVWSQLQFTEGGRDAIEADPLVQQLEVTVDGRTLFIGGEADDALQVSTVLSLPTALEAIVPMLVRATDDDPATVP